MHHRFACALSATLALAAATGACHRKESPPMDLADSLRRALDRDDAEAAKRALDELRRSHADLATALSTTRTLAHGAGTERLREHAVALADQLAVLTAPAPTSIAAQASPGYVAGTVERDEAARAQHERERIAFLDGLLGDAQPGVRVAAAIALAEALDPPSLARARPRLSPIAPLLEPRAAEERDAAMALLAIRGGRQAATWLTTLAEGRPAPLPEDVLVDAVRRDPVAEARAPLERLARGDAALRPGFHASGKVATFAGGSYDPSLERAANLVGGLAAIDPAAAHALVEAAAPDARAALASAIVQSGVARLTVPWLSRDEVVAERRRWASLEPAIARLADSDGSALEALVVLRGPDEAARALAAWAGGAFPRLDVATLARIVTREPTAAARPPVEKLLEGFAPRYAQQAAVGWLDRAAVDGLAHALVAIDAAAATALAAATKGGVHASLVAALAGR